MNNRKEYVKLWLSYETYFEAYTAEEIGQLVLAMLRYRGSGEEPAFQGSERFIWPAIQRDMDEAMEAQETAAQQHRECGRKGGRRRTEDAPEGEEINQIGSEQTNLPPRTRTKDKGHGHSQGQGQGQDYAQAREKMASADRLLRQMIAEAKEEAQAEAEKNEEASFVQPSRHRSARAAQRDAVSSSCPEPLAKNST